MQGQHAAGKEAGEYHDRHGTDADQVALVHDVAPIMGRAKNAAYRLPAKERVLLHGKEHAFGEDVDLFESEGHGARVVSQCWGWLKVVWVELERLRSG